MPGDYFQSVDQTAPLNGATFVKAVGAPAPLQKYNIPAAKAALGGAADVKAAVADNGAQQIITTGIVQPPAPRNVTATTTGTNTNVKAITVTIDGYDVDGKPLQEVLPAFTLDTLGTVVGNKAFARVNQITIPAHDGAGVNTSVGLGAKLGLPVKVGRNTVISAYLNQVKEGTPPTVAVSATSKANNTAQLNSALNGTDVDIYLTAV